MFLLVEVLLVTLYFSSSGGDSIDPYLDTWIWSRKKSLEMWLNRSLSIREVLWLLEELSRNHAYRSLVSPDSGPAIDMVKNWTKENYIFPVNRDPLPWVEAKIEGVPSKYHDDNRVGTKCVYVKTL
ncbi:hypothetical protein A2U01_0014255 [Trifolium medium]|uniref:Uncharacterized protein n=1 Tax=Trifolium medium TaxID=97028 RepID=A0A392N0J5_9FABA|nr:hypothetical protein [Trifolium medium]